MYLWQSRHPFTWFSKRFTGNPMINKSQHNSCLSLREMLHIQNMRNSKRDEISWLLRIVFGNNLLSRHIRECKWRLHSLRMHVVFFYLEKQHPLFLKHYMSKGIMNVHHFIKIWKQTKNLSFNHDTSILQCNCILELCLVNA